MWNQRQLQPPPANSFKVTFSDDFRRKLQKALRELKQGKEVLTTHLNVLASEQYVQEKMIYKLSSQFRSEKSLKHMKQARVCLSRLRELNLEKQVDELTSVLDIDFLEEDAAYLPSRQMFQYYLVKLMSTAALLSRTCRLTHDTYFHAKQLMELEVLIPQNMMLNAIAARLWVTCRSLRSCVCNWYQALFPLLEHLQATPVQWLRSDGEDDEMLPEHLSVWLQSQFDVGVSSEDISKPIGAEEHDLETDEEMDNKNNQTSIGITEDIGEPVQRKSKKSTSEKTMLMDKPCMQDNDDLLDNKTVKKYLRKELKFVVKTVKYLNNIQNKKFLLIRNYEFEITPVVRKKAENMLNACRSVLKANPKENRKIKDIVTVKKFQKILIAKLMKVKRHYKPKNSKQKAESGCLGKRTNAEKVVVDDGSES